MLFLFGPRWTRSIASSKWRCFTESALSRTARYAASFTIFARSAPELLNVFIAVVFSLSRGAWLGVAGVVPLFALLRGRAWIRKNWGVALFAGASGMVLAVFAFGFTPIQDSLAGAFRSRLGIWEAALRMIVANPLWGVGAGMFQTAFTVQKHLVAYPVPVEVALHPHNIFLATWLYGGIVSLVGFVVILFALGKKLFSTIRKRGPESSFATAIALSFAIILIHGMVDTTYWKNDLAFMWWILVVLAGRFTFKD